MRLTLVQLLRECAGWGRAQASDDLWMALGEVEAARGRGPKPG